VFFSVLLLTLSAGTAQAKEDPNTQPDEGNTTRRDDTAPQPDDPSGSNGHTDDDGTDEDATSSDGHTDDDGTDEDATSPVGHTDAHPREDPPRERPVPDYDGLPPASPTAGERALWIPRVLLSPFWLVTEFVLRRPLAFLARKLEEAEVLQRAREVLTFGARENLLLVPYVAFDLGRYGAGGLLFRANAIGGSTANLRMRAYFGGPRAFGGSTTFEHVHGIWRTALAFRAGRRSDVLYFGTGNEADDANRSAAMRGLVEGSAMLHARVRDPLRLSVGIDVRRVRLGDEVGERRSIPEAVAERPQLEELPAGYPEGYLALIPRLRLAYDDRDERGSGDYLSLGARYGHDLEGVGGWVRTTATAGTHHDVSGRGHVLGVAAWSSLVFASRGEVPFLELPDANVHLRAFTPGWLRGASVAAVSASYRWRIWHSASGVLRVAAGGAFDEGFEGFAPGALRSSASIGIAASRRGGFGFEALVGIGSTRFDERFAVDSVRLLFGGVGG